MVVRLIEFQSLDEVVEIFLLPRNFLAKKDSQVSSSRSQFSFESLLTHEKSSTKAFYIFARNADFGGQFHESKLSVNTSQVEQNLHSTFKTRENLWFQFGKIYARWSFPLDFYLMKLTPVSDLIKNFRVEFDSTLELTTNRS